MDKDPAVASAALVSGVHLVQQPGNADVVKRWVAELQEALKSKGGMLQYHALGLLAHLRQHDRLALSKLVLALIRQPLRSQFAHVQLVRYAAQVMQESNEQNDVRALYEFLESSLRHKSDVVMYEAARCLCSLPQISARDLIPAISVLQLFLSSPKATIRFAAARTLNRVANTHPLVVSSCNVDMENLIADPNRSIATLAITTLLKTGSESSIERLMKQISNFMNEISDEFKVVVVEAIRALALKFPAKHRSVLSFLAGCLREEGGFDFKNSIVVTVLAMLSAIPEAKEPALTYLCEFIEDCEFSYLSVKILYVLGKEGPASANPPRFLRFIYNRVVLENAMVRAAAVAVLFKFATAQPALRASVRQLLARSMLDADDEVRDRAVLYHKLLADGDAAPDAALLATLTHPAQGLPPLENLEAALNKYQASGADAPFDLASVTMEAPIAPPPKASAPSAAAPLAALNAPPASPAATEAGYREQLAAIPAFAAFGPLFKSSRAAELTESEVEYVVTCVKHVFAQHLVLHFTVTNTIRGVRLRDLRAKLDLSQAKGLAPHSMLPLSVLEYNVPGSMFVALKLAAGPVVGAVGTKLLFKVQEEDGEASAEDEYKVEDVPLLVSDYVARAPLANWNDAWEAAGGAGAAEQVETYALQSLKSLPDAVREIADFLGMQPCDGSDAVATKAKHVLLLAGTLLGGERLLVRARMRLGEPAQGLALELAIRATRPETCKFLAGAI